MRKLLGWAALIAVAFWVSKNPATAAADVRNALHAAETLISGL